MSTYYETFRILSTKEGKVNTLAKIIKVNIADFSQIEVSQDDKINVILEGIYSELRELKDREKEKVLSSITAESGNSDLNHKLILRMYFRNVDLEKLDLLKDKVANLSGLINMIVYTESKDKIRIDFIFNNKNDIISAREIITKIANNLNMEVVQYR